MSAPDAGDEPATPPPSRGADNGVVDRLRRRTGIAGRVLAGLTVVLAVTAGAWPGWAVGSLVVAIVAGALTAAGSLATTRLLRRSAAWSACLRDGADRTGSDRTGSASADGVPATLGPPKPLHPVRPGQPIRRRVAAQVVPIRADLDGLRSGTAVVVHGRRDRLQLSADDVVRVAAAGPSRSYVIRRFGDGAVFVAEVGLLAAL